ncbi:dimodular nonribosomal peptide synthase-like [Sitodiplosis mosellana]|uniref:dimodular nonribosomal peptide synthase-like n=1 Tax=Sitodiplosis mosellana TaxID=263140 RepID=UPI0024448C8C|nr:dimodular nonribosomal peptide synthase-like [Sitodiplosis mosellana]
MTVGLDSEITSRCIATRAQREIFLIEQTRPDANCNVYTYRVITGAFDLEILVKAIEHIITTMTLLKTRFIYSDGELWQIYDRKIQPVITTIDVTTHSTPFEEALRLLVKDSKKPCGMTTGKLYEFTIYIVDSDKYVLYSRCHHGLIDGSSWIKMESVLVAAYNDLKQSGKIISQSKSRFDALAIADAAYQASDDRKEDEKFWQAYVQQLERFAHTQRSVNSVGTKSTYRQTLTLSTTEYQILQQAAAAMNIPESLLYIGISAFFLRNLLGHDYLSLSLPVRGTDLTREIGMTANILPLLLHIPGHATIPEIIRQIAQEAKSILKHQRYRVDDILKLAKFRLNGSFGPFVNIQRCGPGFEGCSSTNHFGGSVDIDDLNMTFWSDRSNDRLDIVFDDLHDGHSEEQLTALKNHLMFILKKMVDAVDSTVDTLDERCRAVITGDLCESFYVNRRNPIAAGFLQWSRDCDFLIRLVHSNTWVGCGANPFAISKVLLVDRSVGIGKLERVADSVCAKTPGTVVAIYETAWYVAAADGVVEISNFLDGFGQQISAQTLANQCHIIEGSQLPVITPEQAEHFGKAHATTLSSEPYWSQRLTNYEPCQLSVVQNTVNQSPAWAASSYQISKDFSAIEVLTAWIIYIARDTKMSKLQIGWDATESLHENSALACIYAKTVPFESVIDLNGTFSDVVASVEEQYRQLVNHLPCLSDTLIRHASNSIKDSRGKKPWALAVSLNDTQVEYEYSTTTGSELAPYAHGSLMTMQINKHSGAFRWIYDTSRISEKEMNRVSSHLLVLLASAHSDDKVKQPVAKLDLLPKDERDLLLFTWNQETKTYPPACCLHQLFEKQVERDGEAIAVECKGKTLSYSELNAQANRLAHYLIARGVKPDDRIALCVERSTTMLVAILGILKAGGAYVPLDPVYSSQRLTDILQDANPIFLLADAVGQKALGEHQVPVVDLDKSLPDDLQIDNPDMIKLGLNPTHLAYIIYTSGSTGTPKGVMVEHKQVVRLFEATREHFDFNKEDKWCLFHSFSFDVSVWEMWGALSNGSQLSIVYVHSSDEFHDWICAREITVLSQTPSAFKSLMLAKNTLPNFNRLRYLIFAGEAFDPLIAKEWWEKYEKNGTVLVNMYGPTETIHATYQRIDSLENAYSIGRPLADLRAYLLDSYGEPVPLGAEGELYIGGAGVARGYLNRPELTAERFLTDPFSDNPAARMYRTGDRVRYLPDGNLVYMGRMDQQVKIRGFRIELGEIEAHLVEHPQVHEAVVQVQSYGSGSEARLVAYVVADGDISLVQNLRTHLSKLLPDYMIPAAYMRLPSLPLTPNGKLDRRALPAPDDDAFVRQQYEAPQSEMEEKLANIWREVLGIERISRHDNFFELGGHSLHVIHFINKAKYYDVHIDARVVFSFPILKDLAEQISKRFNRLYCDTAIPVRQYGNEAILFVLPDCRGDISYAFELAHDIDKNIPVYVLPWSSPESEQPSSIEEMASTTIEHMQKIQANGPYSIAGYSAGGILAYETAKQLINRGQEISFLGLIDTYLFHPEGLGGTLMFLTYLLHKYPSFTTLNDSKWWARVIELPLNEAVDAIKETGFENIDIDWEVLLSKQRYNYKDLCASMKVDALPIKTYLFRAINLFAFPAALEPLADALKRYVDMFEQLFNLPNLGWENSNSSADFHVIDVDGDHFTLMTDPKSRASLGKKISKIFTAKDDEIIEK